MRYNFNVQLVGSIDLPDSQNEGDAQPNAAAAQGEFNVLLTRIVTQPADSKLRITTIAGGINEIQQYSEFGPYGHGQSLSVYSNSKATSPTSTPTANESQPVSESNKAEAPTPQAPGQY